MINSLKMNRLSFILLSIMLFAGSSCSRKSLKVTPLAEVQYDGSQLVYALPRNVLTVRVLVTTTQRIPGPYAVYAQKFLGIPDAIQAAAQTSKIDNIQILNSVETDPNALFVAQAKKGRLLRYFDIVGSGLILPLDKVLQTPQKVENIDTEPVSDSQFTDLTPTPFIGEERSVHYSKVLRDSSFVRVPVQKTMIVERSMEEKAREAADFIFSLRKKRSELFVSEPESPYQGDALRTIFAQIDQLENEYLSLFIGRTLSYSRWQNFCFTPTNPEGETTILFRFSPTKGIVGATDFSGNPVLLELKPEPINEAYSSVAATTEQLYAKKKGAFLRYRIPVATTISISDGKNDLHTQRELIYQYGMPCMLPISQLKRIQN